MRRSASWHSASGRSGKVPGKRCCSAHLLGESSSAHAGRVRRVCLRRRHQAPSTSSTCSRRVLDALRRASESAVTRWSRGRRTPTSYRTAPPSESQHSCAAALCVRDSLSRRLIMSKPSTVESLSGAAAAIMVACARSGSVWGGTTSRTILLRLSPRTSTVFGGWKSVPIESYRVAAGGEFGGCFRPVAELVQHAVNGPEPHREHREQIGKLCGQVITVRPPCAIDIPGVGRLGFQPQPRRVFGRCGVSTHIGSVLLWGHGDTPVLTTVRAGFGCCLRAFASSRATVPLVIISLIVLAAAEGTFDPS